jgi:phage shock protein PspC (stress-responsive transcriptional regulator)
MKKVIFLSFIFLAHTLATACPTCERQQPKIVRGIIHGTGPEHNWDYIIVLFITIITVLTLFFSIKWFVKPGEKNTEHIKYFIINEE